MADFNIFGATAPAGNTVSAGFGTLAHEFHVNRPAWAVTFRVWQNGSLSTQTVVPRLWQATSSTAGTSLSSASLSITAATNVWFEIALPTPVLLTVGQAYRVAAYFPTNRPDLANYWSSGGGSSDLSSGPLVMPTQANALGNMQEAYDVITNSNAVYPATTNASKGWAGVDITVREVPPRPARVVGQAVARSFAW